jgi:hypothetical protein
MHTVGSSVAAQSVCPSYRGWMLQTIECLTSLAGITFQVRDLFGYQITPTKIGQETRIQPVSPAVRLAI